MSTTTPLRRAASLLSIVATTAVAVVALSSACARGGATGSATGSATAGAGANVMLASRDVEAAVQRGRMLVLSHACGDCHGGIVNPDSPNWMAGARTAQDEERVGSFVLRPSNLTPDSATGIGRFSDRQLFNAMRYGLNPRFTPDVEITSSTPGQGNFPSNPHYLSPRMPWTWWRHMSDQDLHDVVTYLKRGLKPVSNAVAASDAPPDFWASAVASGQLGSYPLPAFPAGGEVEPPPAKREQVLRGRLLVTEHACAGCHGGLHPAGEGYLAGARTKEEEFRIGPFTTRPRNLTPDNTTGMGRFTERQIFNALRYGLRPGETPDVEITSHMPGQGNFPANPKYLAPPMPWPSWRYMSDQQLWDMAAYLKLGVKPVAHRVADSDGPPDFWASEYAKPQYGSYPAKPFPGAGEKRP